VNVALDFVHKFIPSPTGDARTLLVLHGTGGDESSLVDLGQAIAPSFSILSPRGKVLENGAPRFFRRFAEGVFDYDDIRLRSDELGSYIDSAALEYGLDQAKVVAFGYSNGANIAWSTMLRHPEAIAGGILLRPMVTLTEDQPDLTGKKLFVSAGRQDPIVPTENVEQLVTQMQGLGAEVEFNWHPGGHELGREELARAKDWLERAFAD
jgi:predicted esterase